MKHLLCAAQLSRSVYYYWFARQDAPDPDADDKSLIRATFSAHKSRYGYRRITLSLRASGRQINHKRVQRLMQELGLYSKARRTRYRSFRGSIGRVAGNHLNRDFQAQRPNEKWVTDITEFNVRGEKLYLSPVLDLFNQEIIAYRMQGSPNARLVEATLDAALDTLATGEKPMLHSDQGWHYQMERYTQKLERTGLRQSMSRKGNCLDNAVMENFFGHLKAECFHGETFSSVNELRQEIDDYIDYYNHRRIKAKLRGLSPVEYRTQAFGGSA